MSTLTNRGTLTNGPEINGAPKQGHRNGPTHHGISKTKPHREPGQSVDKWPPETTTVTNDNVKRTERRGDLRPSDHSADQLSGTNRFCEDPDTSTRSLERRRTYNISSEDGSHSNHSQKNKEGLQRSSKESTGVQTSHDSLENPKTSNRSSARTHPSQHHSGGDVPAKHSSEDHQRSYNISSGGRGTSNHSTGRRGHKEEEDTEKDRQNGKTGPRRGSTDEQPLMPEGPILIPYVNVPYNTRLQQMLARAAVKIGATPSRLRSIRGSRSVDLLNGPTGAPDTTERGDKMSSISERDSGRRSSVQSIGQAPSKPELASGPRSSVKLRKWANPGRERPTSEILPSKNLRFEKLDGVTRPKKYNTSTGDCMMPIVTTPPRLNLSGVPNFTTVSRRHAGDSPIADRGRQLSERIRGGDAAREFGSIPRGPGERGSAGSEPGSLPSSPRGNAMQRASSSHVRARVNGELWHYIATQWPRPHTEADFWHMVWEHGVNMIVAVTPAQVPGEMKPQRYWPRLGSRQRPSVYGDLAVHATFRGATAAGGCATTGLRVAHAPSGKERNLWHLHHPEWHHGGGGDDDDDDGVERFLEFLQELQSVRRLTGSLLAPRTPLPPTLVHCAGSDGPTGVLILSELMVACLEQNVNADVPQVLAALRQQRSQLVPTLGLYEFVYRVLARYLGRSRLI